MPTKCVCNLTFIVCDRWSLVTNRVMWTGGTTAALLTFVVGQSWTIPRKPCLGNYYILDRCRCHVLNPEEDGVRRPVKRGGKMCVLYYRKLA